MTWTAFAILAMFWVKSSVSWARSALLHGTYCIAYLLNFICKFAIALKNDAFVANIANTRLKETFVARLPNSATLVSTHIQVFVTNLRNVQHIILYSMRFSKCICSENRLLSSALLH